MAAKHSNRLRRVTLAIMDADGACVELNAIVAP
jgi:hypothetical protein